MSYGFNMAFAKVGINNDLGWAMIMAHQFVRIQMLHAKDILGENKIYIPSIKYGLGKPADVSYSAWNEADKNWLYSLFNFRFAYWPEFGILGCCIAEGYHGNELFPLSMYFQNSTDQNYEYSEWAAGMIPYFVSHIVCAQNATWDDIKAVMDVDASDIASGVPSDYDRKSYLYNSVFSELQLNDWLYGKEGNFTRFAINGIDTQEQHMELVSYMKRLRHNWFAEEV